MYVIRRVHRKAETWDAGNPTAVNGFVTWCSGCGQRPWPCDTATLHTAGDALAEAAEKARSLMKEGQGLAQDAEDLRADVAFTRGRDLLDEALARWKEATGG